MSDPLISLIVVAFLLKILNLMAVRGSLSDQLIYSLISPQL